MVCDVALPKSDAGRLRCRANQWLRSGSIARQVLTGQGACCANEGEKDEDGLKECRVKECEVQVFGVRCRREESGGEEDDFASALPWVAKQLAVARASTLARGSHCHWQPCNMRGPTGYQTMVVALEGIVASRALIFARLEDMIEWHLLNVLQLSWSFALHCSAGNHGANIPPLSTRAREYFAVWAGRMRLPYILLHIANFLHAFDACIARTP